MNLKEVHDDWKKRGFPYYPTSRIWRDNIFQQLVNFRRDTLIDRKNKIIGQSAHGLNLAWSYMEHAWGIKCGKMKTPMEVWNSEEHLKKGLAKILSGTFFPKKLAHKITESDMRTMLKRYSGTQKVSNFRPTAAAAMYDIFVDKDSPLEGTTAGTVWDPSMGYGGRLLGAMCSKKVSKYIGIDPSIKTHNANIKMSETLGFKDKVELINLPAEDVDIDKYKKSVNFSFTSPPYFVKEEYADEETQSFKRYSQYQDWIDKFLKKMILLQYSSLKNKSYNLALSVSYLCL